MPKNIPLSLLMYSHDGFGLGHIRRNLNIAIHTTQNIECQALMIMSHNSIPFLPNLTDIDFIKLPSIVKVGKQKWVPRTLPLEAKQFNELRIGLMRETISHYHPDLFIVDYLPGGVQGELIPVLEKLKSRGTRLILGLRDILDDPKTTCAQWEKEGAYQLMNRLYDEVFIYGSEDIFPTAEKYGLTTKLNIPYHYTGYLTFPNQLRSKDIIRQEFGFDEGPLIVITAGGGNDAYPMMQKALAALERLEKKQPLQALFVAGPLMSAQQKTALELTIKKERFRIIPHSDDLQSAMQAADLLITMGSYNTCIEAVRLKKPTIVIPREGPSQEQKIRAKLFSRLGLVHALPSPKELTTKHLSEVIEDHLTSLQGPTRELDLKGGERIVQHLSQGILC